ncbi:MAG: DUF427 domain-containing protein [Proteobacteria bacterium]|nr:DUF427 domain-containing protein [Pseudomonadota bacterium]
MQQAVTKEDTPTPLAVSPSYLLEMARPESRIRVEFNGTVIAESARTIRVREARLLPVYYFPREDVNMALLESTDHDSHCPFKGRASYWTVKAAGRTATDAAWSYEDPLEDARDIKDYIAFYWNRMDHWFEDGKEIFAPERDPSPGHMNPLRDWLIQEAWDTKSTPELMEKLTRCLVENGLPISRFRLIIRTLHPLLAARAYSWSHDTDELEEYLAPYSMLESSEYLDSPFAAIIDGASGLRRRLDIDNPQLDYPILADLKADGCTDYVAMPMTFSDGQINVISLTTKQPGGFSKDDLGNLYEILPLLSRLFESHYLRRTAVTLLDTYLGKQTGRRVLDGHIQRGDGDNLHAIIWFCDLRNSTPLSESMAREDYLAMLNDFLEAMSTPVLENGGEVLRYIGDAALSIFPIQGDVGLAAPAAAQAAAKAAREAVARMVTLNAQRVEDGRDPIGYGIGLHLGDVMYGNIGAPERLEFTVIGAAANEAARIEALTKTLGEPVLMSERFNQCFPSKLQSLGRHGLRGVSNEQEVFTFPPAKKIGDGKNP